MVRRSILSEAFHLEVAIRVAPLCVQSTVIYLDARPWYAEPIGRGLVLLAFPFAAGVMPRHDDQLHGTFSI